MISIYLLFLLISRAFSIPSAELVTPKVNAIVQIVDASLLKAQSKVKVPHNPQISHFIQDLRKVSIDTFVSYHERILKAASKSESQALKVVNMAVNEIYSQMIKILHSSSSIFKRAGYFAIMWLLFKQIFYIMIISIVAMILINIPKSRIRQWYCKDHPCESDQDELLNSIKGEDLDDMDFEDLDNL